MAQGVCLWSPQRSCLQAEAVWVSVHVLELSVLVVVSLWSLSLPGSPWALGARGRWPSTAGGPEACSSDKPSVHPDAVQGQGQPGCMCK